MVIADASTGNSNDEAPQWLANPAPLEPGFGPRAEWTGDALLAVRESHHYRTSDWP